MNFVTKDSGERIDYSSGARRDVRTGKGRYDLIPGVCLKRLADLYERGAEKYSDNNWRKGIPSSRFFDSMIRHGFQYIMGQRDEDHLAAVVFNAFGLMWNEECNKDWYDLEDEDKGYECRLVANKEAS